jgi:hypothetical protein
MLGLSATPNERIDKFDPVAWWGIGPILDAKTLPGYTEANIPFTGKVHMIKYIGPPEYIKTILCEKTQIISTQLMLNNMTQDQHRIEIICNEIKKLYDDPKLFIYVFADRCDYLSVLRTHLIAKNVNCEFSEGVKTEIDKKINAQSKKEQKEIRKKAKKKIVKVTGGASSQEMKSAEDHARIILTTYQYLSVGKSIPKMNAIVLSTPRKSKGTQILGRIFRMCSDYSIERQIIDIVDWATIFKSQWYKRKKIYDEKKFPIEITKIKAPSSSNELSDE